MLTIKVTKTRVVFFFVFCSLINKKNNKSYTADFIFFDGGKKFQGFTSSIHPTHR